MPARGFKKKDLETLMMDNCNLKPYDVSSCTALRENFDLITLTVLTKTEDSGDDFTHPLFNPHLSKKNKSVR